MAMFLKDEYPVLDMLECSEYLADETMRKKTFSCLKKLYVGEYPEYPVNTLFYNERMREKKKN